MLDTSLAFSLRACCADAPTGTGFVEVRGSPGTLSAPDAPVFVEIFVRSAHETDRAIAWHEMGHAIAAIVAGGRVGKVTLRAPNPLAESSDVPSGLVRAVLALAGPHAEALARGRVSPTPDGVVLEHLDIVNRPGGGGCDMCSALRPCVRRVGLDRRKEALVLFREAERATVHLFDHEASRRLLRLGASALVRDGELSGERVHEIAAQAIDLSTLETLKSIINLENSNA